MIRRAWSPEILAKLFRASAEKIRTGLVAPKTLALIPVRATPPKASLVDTRNPVDVAPRKKDAAGTAEPRVA